jgi:hypothetical protein
MGRQAGSNVLYLVHQGNNMTHRVGNTFFSGAGFCRAVTIAALLALSGCGGASTIEDAVPVSQGARDTGSYPNLNIKPEVAAEQFTDAEKNAKLGALKAEQANAMASPGPTTEAADAVTLGQLATSHAGDTLKQIEGGQIEGGQAQDGQAQGGQIKGKCDPALDPTCK